MTKDQQLKRAQRALVRIARKHPLAALLVVAVLLVGSATGLIANNLVSTDSQTTHPPSSVSSDALLSAEVVRVVDGDTLKVRLDGGAENCVRLIGVDTPESVASDDTRNCEEGVEAADYTKSLVSPGRTVWLQRDVSDTDRYGRWLRYVWLEQPNDPANEDEIAAKMLNAVLVREGYAQAKQYKPDTALHDAFSRWGDEALAAGKGVTRKWA